MCAQLWAQRYCPSNISELRDWGTENNHLQKIACRIQEGGGNIPHLILHGMSGSGKSLRARLLLKELYGPSVTDLCRTDTLTFEGTKGEFKLYGSAYHTEINASDLGLRDRYFIQHMIKELAGSSSAMSLTGQKHSCRVFVIHEAHLLTLAAQAALRRTMEKYSQTSRVFLLAERLSSIIPPLRSRCVCIPVHAPKNSELADILRSVAAKANAPGSAIKQIDQVASQAGGNLRRALVICERLCDQGPSVSLKLPWQRSVDRIAATALSKPTVSSFMSTRTEIQSIFSSNIEGQIVLENLLQIFLETAELSETIKVFLTEKASYTVSFASPCDSIRLRLWPEGVKIPCT